MLDKLVRTVVALLFAGSLAACGNGDNGGGDDAGMDAPMQQEGGTMDDGGSTGGDAGMDAPMQQEGGTMDDGGSTGGDDGGTGGVDASAGDDGGA